MSGIQAWDDTPSMEEQFGEIDMSDSEDAHVKLHLYEGDSAFVVRENGNKSLYGVQLPELLALFNPTPTAADTGDDQIGSFEPQTHTTQGFGGDDQTAAAADTGLVERLTLRDVANAINRARYTPYGMLVRDVEDEDKSGYEYAYRLAVAAFDLFTTAAEQREAAAREQIAALTEAVLDAETWLEALVTDAAPGSEDSTHEVIKTITKLKAARAMTLRETNDGQ